MTLLQLSYFVVLARNCHYTKTAQELHISQPTLSYAIKELERELGGPLFERRGGRTELTVYGQAFLPYVLAAQQQLERGKATLSDLFGTIQHTVRIGYFHSIADTLVPALIRDFTAGHRNDEISFQMEEGISEESLKKLRLKKVDLAFTTTPSDLGSSIVVQEQPLYLAIPKEHPLASRVAVSFEEFCREPMIAFLKPSNLRDQIDLIFERRNVPMRIAFEVRDSSVALQHVALSFGLAILPDIVIYNREHIKLLPIEDPQREFVRPIYFSWLEEGELSAGAVRFRDYVIARHAEGAQASKKQQSIH